MASLKAEKAEKPNNETKKEPATKGTAASSKAHSSKLAPKKTPQKSQDSKKKVFISFFLYCLYILTKTLFGP